jgi:hypothetical protein
LTDRHQETTMTTDEAARLHLYEQARTALGPAAADALMSALPRDPDRFATKDDLAALEHALRADVAALEANLRGDITSANSDLLRTLFFGMIASQATLVGLAFAAARLA